VSRSIQSRVDKLETKAGLNRHRTDYRNMTDEELHIAIFESVHAAIAEAGSHEALASAYVAQGADEDLMGIYDEAAACKTLREYLEMQRRPQQGV
jgi:hypothetical protein